MGRDVMGAVLFVVDVKISGTRLPRDFSPPRTAVVAGVVESPASLLPAPQEVLRPGMSATADIDVEHIDDTVTVALASVLEQRKEEDGSITPDRVFVVDGTLSLVVKETPVTLGPSEGDAIAVLSGVAAGTRVVIGPFRALKDLKDGDKVSELSAKASGKDAQDQGTQDADSQK